MFRDSNYEITEFSMAQSGMNQFISPDVLPANFCFSLENIIPSPLGEGNVRYGTSLTGSITNPPDPMQLIDIEIARCFSFIKGSSIKQSILYASYFVQDLVKTDQTLISRSSFSFKSTNKDKYVKNTKVKIYYRINGVNSYLYSEIKDISYDIGTQVITVTVDNGLFQSFDPVISSIIEIWYQRGSIFLYDFSNNTTSFKRGDLSIGCTPRCAYFQQVMLICNGVDPVMMWDGANLSDICDFIIDNTTSDFLRVDANQILFSTTNNFDTTKYVIGGQIKLSVNGVSSILTISAKNVVPDVTIISTVEALPAFVPGDIIILRYQVKPPAFSYIYIAKERVWALGPGPVSLEYRDPGEQLTVYAFYSVNSVSGTGIFNENLKVVPRYNFSNKHPCQDNFEAICEVNGLMAFVGRKATQVFSGSDPGEGGDLKWVANLNIGVFHGDLLVNLANDVYFVSSSGINSFSTLNIAKQFSATSMNAVDSIVKNFVSDTSISNSTYRKCASFKYNDGSICGFKILNNKIVASLFATSLYSWFYLSGDFRAANCFMEFDKQFFMCIGSKIFKYADGNDGSNKIYGDQDGKSLITISWIPGLIKFKGRKGYANKRYELVMNYSSSFNLNDRNKIEISIFGDIPKSFELSDPCTFEYRGDLMDQEPIPANLSQKEDIGLRLRKEYEVLNKRLKFVSSSFWLSVSGYVMNGPITFRRIRLFGIGEKNA